MRLGRALVRLRARNRADAHDGRPCGRLTTIDRDVML